jgi:hypothetical protein
METLNMEAQILRSPSLSQPVPIEARLGISNAPPFAQITREHSLILQPSKNAQNRRK